MFKTVTNLSTGETQIVPLTQDEIDEISARASQLPNPRIEEIKARLKLIDVDSVRALRAKTIGKWKAQDDTKLNDLDAEAEALRVELASL